MGWLVYWLSRTCFVHRFQLRDEAPDEGFHDRAAAEEKARRRF